MKSPFPGMDPYLEAHWRDVHAKLVTYISDSLSPQLPNDLAARTEERVYVQSEGAADRVRELYPDVRILRTDPQPLLVPESAGAVAVAEPLVVRVRREPMTESSVRILNVETGELVTVIEVLSRTNKEPGDGSRQYLKKQDEFEAAAVGLVEIDLIRGGRWVVRTPHSMLHPRFYSTAYRVSVIRGWDQDEAVFYPISMRAPLPTIKVPLREHDEQVVLQLQPLLDQAYRNGRYGSIDYRQDPQPPLDPADAQWADELLRAAGRR